MRTTSTTSRRSQCQEPAERQQKCCASGKEAKGQGGNSGKEDDGNTTAPVLPKAKAKDHDKKGKGKGKGKGMSPEQKKEWPCVFHYTKEGGCLKGKDCPYSHHPKHKHKLDNNFLGLQPLAGYASLKFYHVMSCFCTVL